MAISVGVQIKDHGRGFRGDPAKAQTAPNAAAPVLAEALATTPTIETHRAQAEAAEAQKAALAKAERDAAAEALSTVPLTR
jgi:hypothetical protein